MSSTIDNYEKDDQNKFNNFFFFTKMKQDDVLVKRSWLIIEKTKKQK